MGILLCVKLDIHVLYLQGKERDAEAFIKDSIRMLEEGGERESFVCIRRLQYLSQIYMNSQQFVEAELVQRKILHVVELSKVRLSFSNSGSPVFHMPPPCSVVIQELCFEL
ncbi:uncharacterized protein LOC114424580 isoform X3 [Glycine soja]|uniref:uncharacterized protein LOC114424580 isoform X3 n=1 Tax=Glycine soja TaxID=3848 RepID=UPI00103AC490|nr:uncharacterized protein LOC114424580 isoform X3 [Glycine soja]